MRRRRLSLSLSPALCKRGVGTRAGCGARNREASFGAMCGGAPPLSLLPISVHCEAKHMP